MIISYFRTIFLYLVLIVVIRLMGKRQLSQMEPTEFVVAMLAANLVAIPMQDSGIPIHAGLVPIFTVLALELIFSGLSLRSLRLRRLLCGRPVILIQNGILLRDNLKRTRITLEELVGHLREKDVLDIQTVQYAILETDGNLSVFPFPAEKPASAKEAGIPVKSQYLPVTLISDGVLLEENLMLVGKKRRWLEQFLRKRNLTVSQVWLLTIDKAGSTCLYEKGE